ncbi:MAG: AAA family ATPase [Pseudomonadales bacterium]|nr:AAA family ATPase [Pseudomonadales bacterium]
MKLPSHQEAFNSLVRALLDDGNFSKIVGEVGTGKTMLCRMVLNALENHPNRFVTAYIPHPILGEDDLLETIADELSIVRSTSLQIGELIKLISAEVINADKAGKHTILFIDEAQAIPEESLYTIYLLTQAQANSKRPLQVILFGQPELDVLLDSPMLSQLERGISFSYKLEPMDRDAVEAYLQRRLVRSGFSGAALFNAAAVDLLHEASGGIPRMVNILCHKSLMVAFGKGDRLITNSHVEKAIADTEIVAPKKLSWRQRLFS